MPIANLPHDFKKELSNRMKFHKVSLWFLLTSSRILLMSLWLRSRVTRPFSSLGICRYSHCLSELSWELYRADCKNVSKIVMHHDLQPMISGLLFFLSSFGSSCWNWIFLGTTPRSRPMVKASRPGEMPSLMRLSLRWRTPVLSVSWLMWSFCCRFIIMQTSASSFTTLWVKSAGMSLIASCIRLVCFPFLLTTLDASHSGQTAYCPSFENVTLGLKSRTMRPIFWFGSLQTNLSVSGPSSRLSGQSRQNVFCVRARKRGGYRTSPSGPILNPNEKPPRANGWLIGSWTAPGIKPLCLFLFRAYGSVHVWWIWKPHGGLHAHWPFMFDVREQWFLFL